VIDAEERQRDVMEHTGVAKPAKRLPPAWALAVLEALWEVIKNELDAYLTRLRR